MGQRKGGFPNRTWHTSPLPLTQILKPGAEEKKKKKINTREELEEREEETSHQKSSRKGVLMNEKGAGATGKECLGEAVRCGMASSTLKLVFRSPSGTNTSTQTLRSQD